MEADLFWLPLAWGLISLFLRVGWVGLSRHLGWQDPEAGWRGEAARFFYFVGLPYLALVSGALSPDLLGLKGVDYFTLVLWDQDALAAFQQAMSLLLLEWLLDSQRLILLSLLIFLGLGGVRWHLTRHRVRLTSTRVSLLEIIYLGLHWAFYRAIFWAVTGDLYLGLVWGLALVVGEELLLGCIKQQDLLQHPFFLFQILNLTLTSLLFFYVPNLWLIWPVQGMIALLLVQTRPTPLLKPLRSKN